MFKVGDYIKGINSFYSLTNKQLELALVVSSENEYMKIVVLKHKSNECVGEEFLVRNSLQYFSYTTYDYNIFKVGDWIKGVRKDCLITGNKMKLALVCDVLDGYLTIHIIEHEDKSFNGFKYTISNDRDSYELIKKGDKNMNSEWKALVKEPEAKKERPAFNIKMIKNITRNGVATIVFWKDGTKTVVKADNEDLDEEKALAMAIVKKMSGNNYDYYKVFQKYCNNASKTPVREAK